MSKGSRRRPSPLSRADQDSAWARTFPTREDREVIWQGIEARLAEPDTMPDIAPHDRPCDGD